MEEMAGMGRLHLSPKLSHNSKKLNPELQRYTFTFYLTVILFGTCDRTLT